MLKGAVRNEPHRSLFYSIFPIREQSRKGVGNFHLPPVYFITILELKYDEYQEERKFRRSYLLCAGFNRKEMGAL